MTETLTGAQITVRLLERQGIRTVAGIPARCGYASHSQLAGFDLVGQLS